MSGARAVPDEYEVIVVGTGLTESILAAACAYAGKRVLHLDRHSYYGSRNASFALQRFVEWLRGEEGEGGDGGGGEERARTPISHAARQETNGRTADSAGGGASPDVAAAVAASEAAVAALEAAVASSEAAVASSEAPHTSVPVAHTRDTPEDVTFIGECAAEGTARANGARARDRCASAFHMFTREFRKMSSHSSWFSLFIGSREALPFVLPFIFLGSWEALLAQSNRFNIDLTPQLLLASGEMVDALRSSKIASYLEFKPVQAHLFGGGPSSTLERVPCSKVHSAPVFVFAGFGVAWCRRISLGGGILHSSKVILPCFFRFSLIGGGVAR